MPRHQKTMKDVVTCDKPRRGGKQPLNRGFPNGVTHPSLFRKWGISAAEYIGSLKTTWGIETS